MQPRDHRRRARPRVHADGRRPRLARHRLADLPAPRAGRPGARRIRCSRTAATSSSRSSSPRPTTASSARTAAFWHASGVDVDLGAQGLHVQTQSVVSVLAGGIAFQDLPDPDGALPATPTEAPERTQFTLYAQMSDALKLPDSQGFDYRLLFASSRARAGRRRAGGIPRPADRRGHAHRRRRQQRRGQSRADDRGRRARVSAPPAHDQQVRPRGHDAGRPAQAHRSDGQARLPRAAQERQPAHRPAVRVARLRQGRARRAHRLDDHAADDAHRAGRLRRPAGAAHLDRQEARRDPVRPARGATCTRTWPTSTSA